MGATMIKTKGLKRLRKARGWSVTDVAIITGLQEQAVYRHERDGAKHPRPDVCRRYGLLYGKDPEDIRELMLDSFNPYRVTTRSGAEMLMASLDALTKQYGIDLMRDTIKTWLEHEVDNGKA